MQVFKTYFKLLKKQMIPVIIYTVMFLYITILISSNIKVENTEYSTKKVPIMVVNEDGQNGLISGLLDYLDNYTTFVEPDATLEKRKDALFFREVQYILTIPKGFSESFGSNDEVVLSKMIVPDSIEAISVDNAINNYLNMAEVYLKYVPELDYEQLNAVVKKNLEEETEVTVDVKKEDEIVYSNGFFQNYFNYLGYIMIMAFITGVSMVMHSFHSMDIRRRHTASPLTNRSMNGQLLLANLVYVFGYLFLFCVAGFILNKSRVLNCNTLLTLLNAVVFAVTALSISYLVGITVKSKKAISALSTAISLSFAFISGIFVPQEYLGAPVLKMASFTPTFWYVKANNTIAGINSLQWKEISEIMGYIGIQLGFAAAIISIALVVSKRKRQQAY